MANRNFPNKGNLFAAHCKPVLLDCSFTVTPSNGTGITNLKGSGMIKNVFMHTTTTPTLGNPNPASGVIVVQLKDNYNRFLGGFDSQVSALTSNQTTTTSGTAYVITVLGTATTAQWVAKGLPNGITPALGVAFIATATGTIGGSASVAPTATAGSNIDHIEILGDPNTTNMPSPQSSNGPGGYVVLQAFKAGVLTAPATTSTIRVAFYFDDSTVMPGDGGA